MGNQKYLEDELHLKKEQSVRFKTHLP